MTTRTREAVAPALLVGWAAFVVGLLLVRLPTATAVECTVDVTEDMMRPLLDGAPSSWKCDDLWRNLLLHFHYTRNNLTACETREETISSPEPSFTFCQVLLDNLQREMDDARRSHQSELATRVAIAQAGMGIHQTEKQNMETEVRKINEGWKPIYRELLMTNIGIGNVKQALKYYHLYLEGHPPDSLHGEIVRWVYRDPRRENQRLDNLLAFVLHLKGNPEKVAMYRLIKPEILKRKNQREGYLAAVAGLDAGRIVLDAGDTRDYHLYTELYEPVERRWKQEVLAGRYQEIIAFATSHPMQYGEVETSFSTFKPDEWQRLNLDQFITFPNALPQPNQRLEALLMILQQVKERMKTNFKDHLLKIAKEVDICEAFVKTSKDSDRAQDKLAKVKRQFSEIDGNNDYEYYLKEWKKLAGLEN